MLLNATHILSESTISQWDGSESFRDVTARRNAERALQLTQFTVDRAVDSVFWISPEGIILYVNEAACRTLGYERSELVGERFRRSTRFSRGELGRTWKT